MNVERRRKSVCLCVDVAVVWRGKFRLGKARFMCKNLEKFEDARDVLMAVYGLRKFGKASTLAVKTPHYANPSPPVSWMLRYLQ
jgi:hypothetical protein